MSERQEDQSHAIVAQIGTLDLNTGLARQWASEHKAEVAANLIEYSTKALQQITPDQILCAIRQRVTEPLHKGKRQVYFGLDKNFISPDAPYFNALRSALLKHELIANVYMRDMDGRHHGAPKYGQCGNDDNGRAFMQYYLRIDLTPFDKQLDLIETGINDSRTARLMRATASVLKILFGQKQVSQLNVVSEATMWREQFIADFRQNAKDITEHAKQLKLDVNFEKLTDAANSAEEAVRIENMRTTHLSKAKAFLQLAAGNLAKHVELKTNDPETLGQLQKLFEAGVATIEVATENMRKPRKLGANIETAVLIDMAPQPRA